MKTKTKYEILLLIFFISFLSSLMLSLAPTTIICDVNEGGDVVNHSKYSKTFGIPNSDYGVAIFIFAIILTTLQIRNPTKNKRNLIHLMVVIGASIAIYYFYLQQFVLEAYCKYCIVVDTALVVSLLVVLFNWRK